MPLQRRQAELAAIATQIFTAPAEARSACLALLDEARLHFDVPVFIEAARQLSLIEDQLGDFAGAIAVLLEAQALAVEFRAYQQMPLILEQLGCCHYSLGHYPAALQYFRQAVLLCGRQAELQKTRALALIGIGRVCDAAGEHRHAVRMHQAASQLLQDSGDAYLITMAKINWAVNLLQLDERAAAQTLLQQTWHESAAAGLPHHVAECQYRLAQLARREQDSAQAELLLEEALGTLTTTPYHWLEVNVLAEWAELVAEQAALPQALTILQRGLQLAREDRFLHLELRLLTQAARYAQQLGLKLQREEYERQAGFLHIQLHDHSVPLPQLDLSGLEALAVD
ncbi:hypothetical protein [Chitinibacter tainanensis]|uniref:hypothetical protein n=1 Tax=Chitinibacter tainanensis TaxID=230667 RepID=UPI0023554B2A|nr:hypothetical protein [Chitinibacter tainanensis]